MALALRSSSVSKKNALKAAVKKSAKTHQKTTIAKRASKSAPKKVAPKKKTAATVAKKPAVASKKAPVEKKAIKKVERKPVSKKNRPSSTPQKKTPTAASISIKKKTAESRPLDDPKQKLKGQLFAIAAVKKSAKQSMNSKTKQTLSLSQKNRARHYRHTPIVFTIEDVHRVIEERSKNPEKATKTPHGVVLTSTRKTASGTKTILADSAMIEKSEKKRVLGAASLMDVLGFNPNSKKSAPPSAQVDTSRIAKKHLRYLHSLMELRKHLIEGMEMHAEDVLKKSSKETTGDHSGYGQHMADAASDSFDRDFALGLLSNEQDALFEIEDAVQRMLQGTYGVCEITGEMITEERLCAVPFTRFSLKGQQEYERTHRRKNKHTGGIFAEMTPDEAGAYSDSDSDD
jgi:RNA polymerase-binding transcription factor DksA